MNPHNNQKKMLKKPKFFSSVFMLGDEGRREGTRGGRDGGRVEKKGNGLFLLAASNAPGGRREKTKRGIREEGEIWARR